MDIYLDSGGIIPAKSRMKKTSPIIVKITEALKNGPRLNLSG